MPKGKKLPRGKPFTKGDPRINLQGVSKEQAEFNRLCRERAQILLTSPHKEWAHVLDAIYHQAAVHAMQGSLPAVQTKPGFLERLTNTVKSANSTNIQITWTVSGANPVTAVELTGKDG